MDAQGVVKTKTKSNQSNDRTVSPKDDDCGNVSDSAPCAKNGTTISGATGTTLTGSSSTSASGDGCCPGRCCPPDAAQDHAINTKGTGSSGIVEELPTAPGSTEIELPKGSNDAGILDARETGTGMPSGKMKGDFSRGHQPDRKRAARETGSGMAADGTFGANGNEGSGGPLGVINCPCSCQCPDRITVSNGVRHCPTECLIGIKDGTSTNKGL